MRYNMSMNIRVGHRAVHSPPARLIIPVQCGSVKNQRDKGIGPGLLYCGGFYGTGKIPPRAG